jgi:hypothetical protein
VTHYWSTPEQCNSPRSMTDCRLRCVLDEMRGEISPSSLAVVLGVESVGNSAAPYGSAVFTVMPSILATGFRFGRAWPGLGAP